MMKKLTALALAAALVLALAGCAAPAAGETTVHLQTQDAADSITVSGRVAMEVVPDVARITVGVSSRAATPAAAREATAEAINSTLDALLEMGIEEKDIQTSNMNMRTVYSYDGNGNSYVNGYRMDTSLTILVREMDRAGEVVDAAIAAGTNELDGIEYLVSNRDEVYGQALTDAVELARQKAEALASAAGRTLGAVMTVDEASNAVATVYEYDDVMFANADSGGFNAAERATAIQPGSTAVEAQVRVVFELV